MLVSESRGTSTGLGNHSFAAQFCQRRKFAEGSPTFLPTSLYEVRYFIFSAASQAHVDALFGEENNFIKKFRESNGSK